MSAIEPIGVPRLAGAEPPIRGAFARELDDFVVEEELAYEPSGAGQHLFLWIEKRGIPTRAAVHRLARFLGAPARSFGLAGLKDARAVTRQWLSVEGVDAERLHGWTVDGVRVLRAARHGNKLRLGHARGNRFFVRLRDVPADDLARARRILERVERGGLPNAFGAQRFGRGGSSLRLGLALLRRDWPGFVRELSAAGLEPARAGDASDPRGVAAAVDRRLRSLFLSAVQSEAFNRVLARRLPRLDRLRPGDVAFLHANGASFVVDDEAAAAPRAERFEISPSGPVVGSRLLLGHGEPRAEEEAVFDEVGVRPSDFADLPLGHEARGGRRPLRVPVSALRAAEVAGGLEISFGLPAGAYATGLVRELLGDAPPATGPGPIEV